MVASRTQRAVFVAIAAAIVIVAVALLASGGESARRAGGGPVVISVTGGVPDFSFAAGIEGEFVVELEGAKRQVAALRVGP